MNNPFYLLANIPWSDLGTDRSYFSIHLSWNKFLKLVFNFNIAEAFKILLWKQILFILKLYISFRIQIIHHVGNNISNQS